MLMKFGVDDNSSPANWPALTLNWASKTWQLKDDKMGSWKQVTSARNGRFEYKDWVSCGYSAATRTSLSYGGFDGDINLREYKPATTELYGESNQGGGFRVLAGWVDLEKHLTVG